MHTRLKIIFLGIFLVQGIGLAEPPAWYMDSDERNYPSEWYLVGTGAGSTYDKALFKAQFELSSQIESHIEGEFSSLVESFAQDDQETIRSEYKTIGKTVVQATLIGAEIAKNVEIDGEHYIMLALEKDIYANSLLNEMEKKKESVQKVIANSQALINKGKVIEALELLLDTDEITREIIATSTIYTSMSGENYFTEDILYGPALLSKIRSLISNIEIKKISGDGQTGINGKLLPAPIEVQLVYNQNNDEEIPLENIRLKLTDESGLTLQQQYTSKKGTAEFWETANSVDKGVFYVSVDLNNNARIIRKDLNRQKAVFRYNISETRPIQFSLDIRDENNQPLKEVEDRIAQSIIKSGHYISDDAPFKLSGKTVVLEVNEVDGLGGTQFLAKTEITLFMTSIHANEDIANMTLSAKGMDKKSEQRAIKKSYQNLKVSSKKMSQMLAEAGDKFTLVNMELSKQAFDEALICYNNHEYFKALQYLSQVTDGSTNINNATLLMDEINKELKKINNSDSSNDDSSVFVSEKEKDDFINKTMGNYHDLEGKNQLILNQDGTWSILGETDSGTWEIEDKNKLMFRNRNDESSFAYVINDLNRIVFEEKTYTKSSSK